MAGPGAGNDIQSMIHWPFSAILPCNRASKTFSNGLSEVGTMNPSAFQSAFRKVARFFGDIWRRPAATFIPNALLVVMLYGLLWSLWLFYSYGGSFHKAGGNVEIPARDPWFFVFLGIPVAAAFLFFCVQSLILLTGLVRLCAWLTKTVLRMLRSLTRGLLSMGRVGRRIGEILWLLIVIRGARFRDWLVHLFMR